MAEYQILGTVTVVHDGSPIALGGPRHRRLLAFLVLSAGQVVSTARMADAMWGGAPPPSARAMLHVRVSELRTALRAAGARLVTGDGGYLLPIDLDNIDARRFERSVAAGAAALAAGHHAQAYAELTAGLALWRGPALAEFADEPFARSEAVRLDELRLHAVENQMSAALELGHHRQLVPELTKLVAEHSMRESFWAQLMLALYRAGRRADALAAYHAARQLLAGELGLDPGGALQRLHHAILTADPALSVPGPGFPPGD